MLKGHIISIDRNWTYWRPATILLPGCQRNITARNAIEFRHGSSDYERGFERGVSKEGFRECGLERDFDYFYADKPGSMVLTLNPSDSKPIGWNKLAGGGLVERFRQAVFTPTIVFHAVHDRIYGSVQ
jgi:hypothetical protein